VGFGTVQVTCRLRAEGAPALHSLGYSRVSSPGQDDALLAAGCYRVFTEMDPPESYAAITRELGLAKTTVRRHLTEIPQPNPTQETR